jgi:hypothetical protein
MRMPLAHAAHCGAHSRQWRTHNDAGAALAAQHNGALAKAVTRHLLVKHHILIVVLVAHLVCHVARKTTAAATTSSGDQFN